MGGQLRYLIFVLFLLFLSISKSVALQQEEDEEKLSEALVLRPLPDRKVLAHFHFQTSVPPTQSYGSHHHLFPKSIYQLVHKFRVKEMELSFTQGRWNYERWGGYDSISSSNAKPPGVELWAAFDVPKHEVDSSWKNLTHALSGLFCASINFMEHSTSYSSPKWSFGHSGGKLRYGTLPREAVCTENLTPWLKLLPCRDKAGLASLMDRPSIYRGFYHSQRLHLTVNEFNSIKSSSGIILEQTLSVILQPSTKKTRNDPKLQPSWSLSSLFGRKFDGKCVLAKSSHIYIHFEKNLVSELKKTWRNNDEFLINPSFELSDSPKRLIREVEEESSILFEYSLDESEPFDLGLKWKLPVTWTCEQAPLHATRFLMGSGNERGSIAISLTSSRSLNIESTESDLCNLRVDVFQVVPWYVKVYYHTLKVYINEEIQSNGSIIEKISVSPSEDKVSPGVMEIILKLPCTVNSAVLTIEFDKGFLHIDEYPPDANQGFDIPSALINFPDFQTRMNFIESDDSLYNFPILTKLQERNPVVAYTEVLLVPLTTPDFSMPYNVITITCTVFALYFGSLLNALRRRIGEEERLLKNKDRRGPLTILLSKLAAKLGGGKWELTLKVMIVGGIAIACQYYFG